MSGGLGRYSPTWSQRHLVAASSRYPKATHPTSSARDRVSQPPAHRQDNPVVVAQLMSAFAVHIEALSPRELVHLRRRECPLLSLCAHGETLTINSARSAQPNRAVELYDHPLLA